jgi:hypothetical protein
MQDLLKLTNAWHEKVHFYKNSAEITHHAYKASQIIPSINAMFHIQVRQTSYLNGVFI